MTARAPRVLFFESVVCGPFGSTNAAAGDGPTGHEGGLPALIHSYLDREVVAQGRVAEVAVALFPASNDDAFVRVTVGGYLFSALDAPAAATVSVVRVDPEAWGVAARPPSHCHRDDGGDGRFIPHWIRGHAKHVTTAWSLLRLGGGSLAVATLRNNNRFNATTVALNPVKDARAWRPGSSELLVLVTDHREAAPSTALNPLGRVQWPSGARDAHDVVPATLELHLPAFQRAYRNCDAHAVLGAGFVEHRQFPVFESTRSSAYRRHMPNDRSPLSPFFEQRINNTVC